jgi:ubiquinone/menaquinone biosynthesis C-methylase UbiE
MVALIDNPGYIEPAVLAQLAALTQPLKQRTRELLEIKPGDRVIDVGCGPGIDTIALGHLVGPSGFVAGLDHDQGMIQAATETAARYADVFPRIHHVVADARSIPFQTAAFDACQCERVLQHLKEADLAFAEMVRVVRPGGRIAVADADWGTLSIDTPETRIERSFCLALPELQPNGYAGREIYHLFREHGLVRLTVEAQPILWTDYAAFRRTSLSIPDVDRRIVASGTVSREELRRFLESLKEADREGRFFASGNIILVAGTKPEEIGGCPFPRPRIS